MATMLRMRLLTPISSSAPVFQETWRVTSAGTVPGARTATVQAEMVIERSGTPLFNWAFYATGTGCKNVLFGGGGYTDSWDSTGGGTYAGTVHNPPDGGDIGSNGNITLTGGSDIYGKAY
jgi:hypothetical protein